MIRIFFLLLFYIGFNQAHGQSFISGKILWMDSTPFDLSATVGVKLVDPSTGNVFGQFSLIYENGEYRNNIFHFVNPLLNANLEVSVSANVSARTGVSVLDILRVIKHVTGSQPFINALEIYAADVNASESISALDLVEMRKMILGFYTSWPKRETITFFHRTGNDPPDIGTNLVSTIMLPWGGTNGTDDIVVDFWAVKTGDVVR